MTGCNIVDSLLFMKDDKEDYIMDPGASPG